MILNNIKVNILSEVELSDAYNRQFPDNLIIENVIYCVHNKINNKNYIGQTVNFLNRFSNTYVGHFRDYNRMINGELDNRRILYAAWKKYGFESFIVYIIDTGADRKSLNEKEMYWIKALHTCTKDPECLGYNLTWGAEDVNWGCPEAIQRSLQTRREKYGNAFANCHTKEALDKGNQTKIKKYGQGGFVNAFTPEANEKRIKTNMEKYGEPYGPTSITMKNNLEKYGHVMGLCNTPENREKGIRNRRITLCFKTINKILSESSTKITNFPQYYESISSHFSNKKSGETHLEIILELLQSLKQDKRWTQELENIFGHLTQKDIDNIKKGGENGNDTKLNG